MRKYPQKLAARYFDDDRKAKFTLSKIIFGRQPFHLIYSLMNIDLWTVKFVSFKHAHKSLLWTSPASHPPLTQSQVTDVISTFLYAHDRTKCSFKLSKYWTLNVGR